jgi:hypothetical protein
MPYSIQKALDANGKLINGSTLMDFTGVTDVGDHALHFEYTNVNFPENTEINFPSLISMTGDSCCSYMFSGCKQIISANFPVLEKISASDACQSMFSGCDLTSINFPALEKISASQACRFMFSGCKKLTIVEFPSLSDIKSSFCCRYMFFGCTSLTSLSFPALTSSSFGTNRNQFDNLVGSVTGCTIHFPSNLDPESGSTIISSLTGYPNFAGTNTVLAFDLPATE